MEIVIKHSFGQIVRRELSFFILRLLLLTVRGLVWLNRDFFYAINWQLALLIGRLDPLDYDDRGCSDYEEYLFEISMSGELPLFYPMFQDDSNEC